LAGNRLASFAASLRYLVQTKFRCEFARMIQPDYTLSAGEMRLEHAPYATHVKRMTVHASVRGVGGTITHCTLKRQIPKELG
jgi:hypothetical protein